MKVINLYGGPGSGKSTTASHLFSIMKLRGHKVELVTEYAKELTYDKKWDILRDQNAVIQEQYNRQKRVENQVDYIITDSPLPLGLIYAQNDLKNDPFFWDHILDLTEEFNNFNVLLKRVKPYSHYGRKESSEKAIEIDREIKDVLERAGLPYANVRGDEDGAVIIYNMLFHKYYIELKD